MPRDMDGFQKRLETDQQLRMAFEHAVANFARKHGFLVEASDVREKGLQIDGTQPRERDLNNGHDEGKRRITSRHLGEEDRKTDEQDRPRDRFHATTMALGEEEHAPRSRPSVTQAIGEEDTPEGRARNGGRDLPKPDNRLTTLALGEEDSRPAPSVTLAIGEEDKPAPRQPGVTTLAMGEEDKAPRTPRDDEPTATSLALGEEDSRPAPSVTLAIGEEDKPAPRQPGATTLAMGEEDKAPRTPREEQPTVTTLAVGEEDKKPTRKKGGPKPR